MWPVVHMYKWKIAYRSEASGSFFLLRHDCLTRKPSRYLDSGLELLSARSQVYKTVRPESDIMH